jgi:hypothetical protein
MHLTFVEAGRAGKRWRLRESGLYPYQPETWGDSTRFLTYTAPQPPDMPDLPLRNMPQQGKWPDGGTGWSVATALHHVPHLEAHMRLVDARASLALDRSTSGLPPSRWQLAAGC